ncbi:hypothetical protein IIA16_06555 [bacterium]|nr:hypothetical protein [bacterium]
MRGAGEAWLPTLALALVAALFGGGGLPEEVHGIRRSGLTVQWTNREIPGTEGSQRLVAVADGEVVHVVWAAQASLMLSTLRGKEWETRELESWTGAGLFLPVSDLSALATSDGALHVAYISGSCLRHGVWAGAAWQAETLGCAAQAPAMAAGPRGEPMIAYISEGDIHLLTWEGSAWLEEVIEAAAGTGGVDIALHGHGELHLVWDEGAAVRHAWRQDGPWRQETLSRTAIPGVKPLIASGPGEDLMVLLSEEDPGARRRYAGGNRLGWLKVLFGGPGRWRLDTLRFSFIGKETGYAPVLAVLRPQELGIIVYGPPLGGGLQVLVGEPGAWSASNPHNTDTSRQTAARAVAVTGAAMHMFVSDPRTDTLLHLQSDWPSLVPPGILTVRKMAPSDWGEGERWNNIGDLPTDRIDVFFEFHPYAGGSRAAGLPLELAPRPGGGADPANWRLCGPDAPRVVGVVPADELRAAFTLELAGKTAGEDFWAYAVEYRGPEGVFRYDFLDAWRPPWRPRKTAAWYAENCPS